jgi:hypothetical protein
MRLNIAHTEMGRVIQDDERMFESILAQVENESRTAREKREKAGGFSSTCKVSQRSIHDPRAAPARDWQLFAEWRVPAEVAIVCHVCPR